MLPQHLGQSDTQMQASPEPQSRFSLHLWRPVGHLEVVSCFTHSGPSSGFRHGHRTDSEPEKTLLVPGVCELEAMHAPLAQLRQAEADLAAPERAHHPPGCST